MYLLYVVVFKYKKRLYYWLSKCVLDWLYDKMIKFDMIKWLPDSLELKVFQFYKDLSHGNNYKYLYTLLWKIIRNKIHHCP